MGLNIYEPEVFDKITTTIPNALIEYVDEYVSFLKSNGTDQVTRELVFEAMCEDSLNNCRKLVSFRSIERQEETNDKTNEKSVTENPKLPIPKVEDVPYTPKRQKQSSKLSEINGVSDR